MKNLKRLFLDKRGGGRLLSIWWFLVLIIVGVGIVAGVLIFFSAETDARQVESKILYGELASCLTSQGFLIEEVRASSSLDIFDRCSIKKEIFETSQDIWYFEINFYDSGENKKEIAKTGAGAVRDACLMQLEEGDTKGIEYEGGAKCTYRNESVLYYNYGDDGTEILIGVLEIMTASNQRGKKTTLEN